MTRSNFIITTIFLFSIFWGTAKCEDFVFDMKRCYKDGEIMSYEVKEKDEDGNLLYTGTIKFKVFVYDSILSIQGSSEYSNDYFSQQKFQYDLHTNYPVSCYNKTGKSGDYKENFVNFQNESIQIKRKEGNSEVNDELDEEGVVYDSESTAFILKGYPFLTDDKIEFKLLVDYEDVYTMFAEKVGEEEISVPYGKIDCYKLKFRATGSIFIDMFAPTIHIWFSKKDHIMVKIDDGNMTQLLKDYAILN